MLVVGIDVAAEVHQVAVIDETESVVVKPTALAEDAAGCQKLFELLARAGARGGGDLPLAPASAQPERTLVVMEATGHYWQNSPSTDRLGFPRVHSLSQRPEHRAC